MDEARENARATLKKLERMVSEELESL